MSTLPPTLRAWLRRVSRPLPAAVVVCAAGLTCAVFAIGVNRIIATRALLPGPVVVPTQGTRPTPSPSASPGPTPAAATPQPVSCAGADHARGDLSGTVVMADAQVSLTDGETTLDIIVPAGTLVDGSNSDVHMQAGGAGGGGTQPLHGTLLQSAMICVQSGQQVLQLDIPSGTQVDGSASPGANGAQAQDIHLRSD